MAQFTAKEHKLLQDFSGMGVENAFEGAGLDTGVDYDVDALVRAVLRLAHGRPTPEDVALLVSLGVFDDHENVDDISWLAGWVLVDEKLQLGIPLDAGDCDQLLAFSEVSAGDDAAHDAIHRKLTKCAWPGKG